MAAGVLVIAALLVVLSVVMLERQRAGVSAESHILASSPVTIWRADDTDSGPLVVVAHGYAGSRQMMMPVSIALARLGFVVATFDFYGHGRHRKPMSGDITSLEGTTAQLVDQTVSVARAARDLPGVTGPISLVGHSMATDVVIRAAERIGDTDAVVAISMYSDAVTPDAPQRLLIVSGAMEGRLHAVALDRLRQLDPDADEGETVRRGPVERRAVSAPWVGHVGVLYSPFTLDEIRNWVTGGMDRAPSGELPRIGPWLLALLTSLVVVIWPISRVIGPSAPRLPRLGKRRAFAILAAPVAPALLSTVAVPPGAGGVLAFGALAAFFGTWGAAQLALLWRDGLRPKRVHRAGLAILLIWGLGVFAVSLDRYGAAFVPTGLRLWIMGLLMLGTVPFCIADALLVARSGWVAASVQRLLPLVALLCAMLITPTLGVAFTVLPVTALFWLVYGLAARWIRARSDPVSAGLALGIILAWSIAASTPLLAS